MALASDGTVTFTPSPDLNGTAAFTYAANTPEGGRAEATVTIQVTPVNDAPLARADRMEAFAEGTSVTLDPRTLLANESDIDGDTLTVRSVRSSADIAVSIGENGLIRVVPRAYYWGEATFDYVVADAAGATATGQVRFTVTPVNDPPDLSDDRFETTESGAPIREDNPIVIGADRLIANDVEHDGEAMTVTAVRGVRGGSPQLLENGTVLFTPWTDFNGEAAFEYRVEDGHGGVAWARATLVYQPVNDLPGAADDHHTDRRLPILRGREDEAIEIPTVEFVKNDADPEGFTVRFESAGSAIHGDNRVTDHGTIVFTPDADYWGEATFAYLVSDPEGAVDGAAVTLWFENIGDAPPVARRDVIYVNEDIPVVIPIAQLMANDSDVDRDPLRFVGWRETTRFDALTYGAEAGGTLNGTIESDGAGNLVFTPDRGASRSAGFVYRITDDADGEAEAYVEIVVVPSNDDPTVGEDEGFVTPLGVPLVLRDSDLLANDFDIEQADRDGNGTIDDDLDDPRRARPTFAGVVGVYDTEALALGDRIPRGQAEVETWAGETFVVVRCPEGFTGAVAVEYRITDAEGATDTGFAMARIDAAYGGSLRGTSRADLLVGSAGADIVRALSGNDLVRTGAGDDVLLGGDDLLLEFERQDGFLVDTVRARGHFLGRETGLEEVVFSDGTVWSRERLDALQRLGRFNAVDDVVRFACEDEPLVIDPARLIENDSDGGTLTLVGVGAALHGSVALRPDGRIAFLGAPDFNGDAFFAYTVRDAFGRESSARVEVDLAPVNDAPTALDDPTVPAIEDRILRIRIASLLANDSDVDGEFEGLHIVRIDPLTNGAGAEIDRYKESEFPFAATNATGRIDGEYLELRLRPDYFGPAGFVYTLGDADGATATARVEIAVAPVNDAPRDHDRIHEIRLGRDASVTVADLLADTYDVEGDAITFVGLHAGLDGEPGSNGRAVLDAGRVTFTPSTLGSASIAYDVADARGAAATLTYDFRVRPLNDAPRAADDYGLRTLEDRALVIDPAVLLANDTDENGDTLVVESVARFAEGGKVRLREDGRIEFRPKPDYNGAARFAYTVSDGRGGTATAAASITILPRNEGPILRNDRDVEGDGFTIVEVFDGDQGSVLRDGATAVFRPHAGVSPGAGGRRSHHGRAGT